MSETKIFKPLVKLPDKVDGKKAEIFAVWATIPANDEKGAIIDNVLPGDQITVTYGNGKCSFRKTNMSTVSALIGIMITLAEGVAIPTKDGENAWTEALKSINKLIDVSELKHGVRDVYGEKNNGNYAIRNGGLIVCMPSAGKAIYAKKKYYLRKSNGFHPRDGRRVECHPQALKDLNSFLPCDLPHGGGQMSAIARKKGVATVLPFDSNHGDNHGAYVVKFEVIRAADKKSSEEIAMLRDQLHLAIAEHARDEDLLDEFEHKMNQVVVAVEDDEEEMEEFDLYE